MIHYLETHGIEVVIAYFAFASMVSTMPPLPDTSSYWSKWVYGFLHALASDWKQVMAMAKIPIPEPDSNSTFTKTEIKKTIVENKTEGDK